MVTFFHVILRCFFLIGIVDYRLDLSLTGGISGRNRLVLKLYLMVYILLSRVLHLSTQTDSRGSLTMQKTSCLRLFYTVGEAMSNELAAASSKRESRE